MTVQITACCEMMNEQLSGKCEKHLNKINCPDFVVVQNSSGFGLPVRDGGDSSIGISFCPWCGKKLVNTSTVKMKALISNECGYICISMRGQGDHNIVNNLKELLENAVDNGEQGIEVEIKVEENRLEIIKIIGPSSV